MTLRRSVMLVMAVVVAGAAWLVLDRHTRSELPYFIVVGGLMIMAGVLIVAIPFLLISVHLASRKAVPPGHCACGYNLAGNTTGFCPECGASVSDAA